MNNKILYLVVFLLSLVILSLFYLILSSGNFSLSPQNEIVKFDRKKLAKWKQEKLASYRFHTNLDFSSWAIVNLDLEATAKQYELVSWVKTQLNTYNKNSIEPLIIKANVWDRLNVNFKNSLDSPTSIHWHWLRLPNSQDWTPPITQNPIWANKDYKYSFVLNDPWTFIFHPHINHSEQIGKWLYGILVVKEKQKINYSRDIVWVLKDYRVWRDGKIIDDFWNMHDAVHDWMIWNIATINNKIDYKLDLKPWEIIRVRLVNISNARIYNLDFSKFDARLIWTDGGLIDEAQKLNNLEIAPWERYELELKIWKTEGSLELFDKYFPWYFVKLASLNVSWDYVSPPEITLPKRNLSDFRDAPYNKPDMTIDLGWAWVMWWDKSPMMIWWQWWTINDGIFPKSHKPIKLEKGNLYILRLKNNTRRVHPMHLHWDFFQVISVNGKKPNYVSFKDTVLIKPLEYVDIAYIPTNNWKWMFHCHILSHADIGMMTSVFVE